MRCEDRRLVVRVWTNTGNSRIGNDRRFARLLNRPPSVMAPIIARHERAGQAHCFAVCPMMLVPNRIDALTRQGYRSDPGRCR
jgi:hypothetical protein